MHLLVESTGVRLREPGEWFVEKHYGYGPCPAYGYGHHRGW